MRCLLAFALCSLPLGSTAQEPDAPLPRSMTPAERAVWESSPPVVLATDPPTGPVRCVAEYEPMEGLVVAWEGLASWQTILTEIIRNVTGPNGRGIAYVSVDSTSEQSTVSSQLASSGIDLSKVRFIVTTTDSIWIRDYGPRYIYQGGVRTIVDHVYNRPRPNDDAFPFAFGALKRHRLYGIPLVHGGGNFHLDAHDRSYVTRLINNENPGYTEPQIWQLWQDYQRVDTTFFNPFPTTIDSTQHIDMWLQVVSDSTVVVSDWPSAPGSTQDVICDNAATYFADRGYTVYRTPAVSVGGTHYTYTNVVVFNDLVIVPTYTATGVSQYNSQALSTWALAAPGKQIVPLNGQAIVTSAGVFHCIVMHVPVPSRGANPAVYVTQPNGRPIYQPGQQIPIRWVSDDDQGVASVDVSVSLDGGATWTPVEAGGPDDGECLWTAPNRFTRSGLARVMVRDGDGNTGSDTSDGGFVIRGPTRINLHP